VPLNQLTLTLIMLNLPMRFLCIRNCAGSKAYQAFRKETPKSSCEEEEPRTQRPFEALQRLLKEDEEV